MIKALETNSVQNVELNLPNGKSFEILAAPLPSQDGTVDRAIEVVLDVTERKHAERERRALECQLQHAHRLESLGVLAGGIAHDFNNLLAAIMGNTDLAMGDVPRDSETYACLEEVRAAGQRAKELIQQILAFSRREDQNRKPLRAQTVLKEALKLLRGSLPTTIELRLDIDPSCGMILADPTQVHQIVMNLCANAYHAMRERGGVLSVSLAPVTLSEEEAERHVDLCPGEYTRLVVSDTGHGMDEATQQRIFEPYFTTKEKSEGTGLGLATVHGIVTHWGGGITVESETEKGATVTVLFPVCQDAATDMRSGAETDDAIPTGTERVLLVDDDEAVVRFESRMLTRWGYDVTSCHNSFDAFDAFRLSPGTFDIVITDYTMPMMTGIDLSKELLQIRPDIPILLCTGFSEMVDESVAKDAGVREFLMKPVTPYDLAHAIRRLAQPHASPSA